MARLNPVDIPNIRQNTPGYDELMAELIAEEAARQTELAIDQQIADLIAQFRAETTNRTVPDVNETQGTNND